MAEPLGVARLCPPCVGRLLANITRLGVSQHPAGPWAGATWRRCHHSSVGRAGAGYPDPGAAGAPQGSATASDGAGFSFLDKLLIADFVFILFALAWLVAGVAQNATAGDSFLFESWFKLWKPVFQPALGVFMLAAIFSALKGKFRSNE